MKGKWKGWTAAAVLVVIGVCAFLFLGREESETDTPKPVALAPQTGKETEETTLDTIQKGPNTVEVPDKASVFVVKNDWLRLQNDDSLHVSTGPLKGDLPDDVRFVLVPFDKSLTEREKAQLQTWLDEKITILFYGKEVDAKKSLSYLGVEGEAVSIESNASLQHILYGYGYSYEYGGYMPLFLKSNATDGTALSGYIRDFLFEKRGF